MKKKKELSLLVDQYVTRSLRSQNPADVVRLYWCEALLCNRFVHFRTPENLKSVVLHHLRLVGCQPLKQVRRRRQGKASLLLLTPISFFLFTTRWSRLWNSKKKEKGCRWPFMFIYFTFKHQQNTKQTINKVQKSFVIS